MCEVVVEYCVCACLCVDVIDIFFLCAPIKLFLHKTCCVLLVLSKVRLAARVHFHATITICDNMSYGATVGASAANSNLIEFKNNFYPCLE